MTAIDTVGDASVVGLAADSGVFVLSNNAADVPAARQTSHADTADDVSHIASADACRRAVLGSGDGARRRACLNVAAVVVATDASSVIVLQILVIGLDIDLSRTVEDESL